MSREPGFQEPYEDGRAVGLKIGTRVCGGVSWTCRCGVEHRESLHGLVGDELGGPMRATNSPVVFILVLTPASSSGCWRCWADIRFIMSVFRAILG